MDKGKYPHSDQQKSTPASSSATAQGETSEKGFYDPFHLSKFNTSSSLPPSLPFSAESRTFPGATSLMSRDEGLSDPPGLPLQIPPTAGMQVWNSSGHPPGHPVNSVIRSRPLTQNNPPHFEPGALAGQSSLQAHIREPQMAPGHTDPSVSLTQQASQSLFPVSSLPTHFASGPYTHRDSLTGQYMSASHPHPFQNPPSQSYMYPGYHPHPADPGQYRPAAPGYFTIPQQHPQAYFPQRLAMEGGNPSHPQASRPSVPGHQPSTGDPGSPHTRSYGGQPYQPLLSSPTSHFGYAQQQHPSVYQWYYLPGSSALPFNKGVPIQFQQYPGNYPQQSQPSLHPDTLGGQPMERPPSPHPKHVASSSTSSTAQNSLPLSTMPPDHSSAPSSPTAPHDRNHQTAASPTAFHVHERHLVRRNYHPNPPPNRSEWVMWVGNVPNDSTHDEIWRFLNQPASPIPGKAEDDGVISIFLISRSSCAFVNYQSEEHLNRAISRFNGRQLRPHDRRCPRLVCRARRKEDDLRAGVGAQRGMGVHIQHVKKAQKKNTESAASSTQGHRSEPCPARPNESERPLLVPSTCSDEETAKFRPGHFESPKTATRSSSSHASTSSSLLSRHFPKRFFILKSLTQYDLDLSVERGVWATQKHNETILDQAYRTSKEVILIFSVNKSGEFYGYAQMTSRILHSDYSVSWASRADSSPSSSSHLSSHTQDIPGESDNPPSSSPQMYTSPSGDRRVGGSPLPIMPSPAQASVLNGAPSRLGIGTSMERQSAPPAVGRQPQADLVPDVPVRSSFSCSNSGWPVTSSLSTETTPGPGGHPAARPAARNKGGAPDPGTSGTALRTVTEEMHTGNAEEDSVRGVTQTGFSPESHDQSSVQSHESREVGWGRTFNVEWLSTERVPFHRTRHLRNSWNHDREIKVSRDGTELEPGVGQELLDQWSIFASEPAEGGSGRSGKRGAKSAVAPAASGV